MTARTLLIHALSPLHPGTGQGVGVIDLPIAREKATGLPYLPGSSLKGVLRDQCSDENQRLKVFGPETDSADEYAGSAQFSDQRLLLLPIRSLKGTFAWVTSPFILRRLLRDVQHTALNASMPGSVPEPGSIEACITVSGNCALFLNTAGKNFVILEELDLEPASDLNADDWAAWLAQQVFPSDSAWQDMLKARFCIVHDDTLNFLLETATEVTARIKLQDDSKTVQKGGLWYEEALPTETVLAGLVVATPVKKTGMATDEIHNVVNGLLEKPLQFGGKATVGRGICQVRLV
jgi:CRISPR-associated protein Cmr4